MTKILIGKITSAHGIKGAVNIVSFTSNPQDIANYKPIFDKNGKEFQIKIISAAKGKNRDIFITEIANIKTRNEAELIRNTELFINRNQLAETRDDEFYHVDLIGLVTLDMDGNKIGKVINVYDFGAGPMIEVEFTAYEKEKIQTLPFTNQIVPEVSISKGYLRLDIPPIIEIKDE